MSDAWASALEPLAARGDREGWLPDEALALLVEHGALARAVRGAPEDELALHRAVGRHCGSARALLVVHGMAAHAIRRFGAPSLRERWLPRMERGEDVAALALSEPGVGSDHAAVTTRATPDGDAWRLTGTKSWLTWGASASLFVVFARAPAGPTAFLVRREEGGVRTERTEPMLGLRGARLATLVLEGARGERLGREGAGALFVASECLDRGRFLVAAGLLGAMERCLDEAVREARGRTQGGAAIATHAPIQRHLARMHALVTAARALLAECVALRAADEPEAVPHTMTTKLLVSEWAAEVADRAVQVAGARGLLEAHPAARHLRDARVARVIEGTTELLELTLGRAIAARAEGP